MKRFWHTCHTSHREVMFRCKEDIDVYVNVMAVQCYRGSAGIISDAEMSTHVHKVMMADDPLWVDWKIRHSYTLYFNRKYGRKGRLGEKGIFILPLDGYNHIGTARNYLYQMNRLTGEAWMTEQQKDKTDSPPVTLDLLEPGNTTLSAYLANESGRDEAGRSGPKLETKGIGSGKVLN